MKKTKFTKAISIILAILIFTTTFSVLATASSPSAVRTEKASRYLILSKWHLCRLVEQETPTCTEDGYAKYKCLLCRYTKTITTSAYGHSEIINETVAPSCTEDGYTEYKCERCDYSRTTIFEKTGHKLTETVLTKPTCTTDGLIEYKCDNCNYAYSTVTHKTGHSVVLAEKEDATCTEDGYEYYVCENCDYEDLITFEKTGHFLVVVPGKEPTCTEDGCTEKTYCDICNKTIKGGRVLPAKHSYETVVTKATLEQDGYSRSECTVCGDVKEEIITKPLKLVLSEDVIYYYTGYEVEPEVVVYDANENVIDRDEYTIQYEDNVEQGKGKVIAVFTGEKYEGQLEAEFLINYCVKILVSKVRGKGFSAKFTVTPAVQKYQIQYYDSPSKAKTITKTVNVSSRKTITYTAKGLNVSPYTVRVRVMIDGRWSNWGGRMINIQSY